MVEQDAGGGEQVLDEENDEQDVGDATGIFLLHEKIFYYEPLIIIIKKLYLKT